MRTLRSAAAMLLVWALGCDSGAGPLVPVRGKVSYKGTPLHAGSIVFTPDPRRGTGGSLARADIQSDGTYVLRTGDAAGVVPGWHRVTVAAVEHPGPGIVEYPVPRTLVPERYRDPELSGLTCEVKTVQQNTIDFNLD